MRRWSMVLPGAVAALLLAVLTWQVLAGGPLTGFDVPVHRWVLRHPGARSSPVWAGLADLADPRFTVTLIAILGAALWRRRRAAGAGALAAARPLAYVGTALAAYEFVLLAMKVTTGRASPDMGSDAALAGGSEFPSGHTSAAMVTWGVITFLALCLAGPRLRRYRAVPCFAVGGAAGLLAGIAVVRMDYHWLTDAVGGWLLGVAVLNFMIVLPRLLGKLTLTRRHRESSPAALARSWEP